MECKTRPMRVSLSSCIPFVLHCILVARDILLTPHYRAPQPGQPFNPTSVSLDIRTPEELQAVNAFLLALGRNIAALPCTSLITTTRTPSLISYRSACPDQRYALPINSDTFAQFALSSLPGLAAAHGSHSSFPQSLHGGANTDTRRAPTYPICIAISMIDHLGSRKWTRKEDRSFESYSPTRECFSYLDQ